jgi:hypothetical protein
MTRGGGDFGPRDLREEESEQDANCERNATKYKIEEKQAGGIRRGVW